MLCGPGKARPAALGAHRRFAASPPDPQVRRDRAELRAEVLARAEQDCAGVYAAVSAVKMIPFVERSRPLMMVPDMTVHEEEKLYRAGITTVSRLARGEPGGAGGLSPERLAELRLGARRLVARRLWFGFGLAGIAGAVLFLGSMSLGLYGVEPDAAGRAALPAGARLRAVVERGTTAMRRRAMSRRTLLALLAGGLLCLAAAPAVHAGGRERLVVENRTGADVEVYVWRYNGVHWEWSFVTRIGAGFGAPISEVHENERFRAWLYSRSEHQYHTVRLKRGGDESAEDRWPIS